MVLSFILFALFVIVEICLEVSLAQSRAVKDEKMIRSLLWDLGELDQYHNLYASCADPGTTTSSVLILLETKLKAYKKKYTHAKRKVPGIRKTSTEYKAFASAYLEDDAYNNYLNCDTDGSLLKNDTIITTTYDNAIQNYRTAISDEIHYHLKNVHSWDIGARITLLILTLFFCYAWRCLEGWDPENAELLKRNNKPKKSFIHDIAVAIVVADKSMTIQDVNEATSTVFGWTREELIGQNVTMLMPESLRKNHQNYINYFLQTRKAGIIGNTRGRNIPGVHKDGSELHLIINISMSGEDQKNNPLFTALFQDVSQQVKAQEAEKQKQKEMFQILENQQNLLQHLHAPVCIANDAMVIQKVNIACCITFGYAEDDLVGQNVKVLMFKEDSDAHDERVNRYKTTGEKRVIGKSRTITGRTKHGSKLHLILNMAESRDASGTQYVAIFHDMTEVFEQEEKKKKEMAELLHQQETLLQHLHAPVCIATDQLQITKVNEACCHTFGYREDELLGQNVKILMFQDDADAHDARVQRYKDTGVKKVIGKSRTITGKTKQGSKLDLILNMAESKDASGTKYIAIFHDMTNQGGAA